MFTKFPIQMAVTIAAVIWAVMLLIQGADVDSSFLRPYSAAVGGAVIVLTLFDRYMWRWPLISKLAPRPVFHGTWHGNLNTNWQDPTTGNTPGPITVVLSVRQTFSTVKTLLMTEESTSESLAAAIDGNTLWATYMNIPRAFIRDRSPIHRGAVAVTAHGRPVEQLEGEYWTDRLTLGEMRFERHLSAVHTSFKKAAAAFRDG